MAIHYDLVTRFLIQGKVFDKSTHKGISGVEIIFLDRSLDYKRSGQSEKFKISTGKSSEDGKIEIKLDYFWGYIKSIFNKKPRGDFTIRLSKNQYTNKDLTFNLYSLKKDGSNRIVNLGDVELSSSIPLTQP